MGSSAITATLQGEEAPICAMRLGYAGGIVVAHHDGQGIVASDSSGAAAGFGAGNHGSGAWGSWRAARWPWSAATGCATAISGATTIVKESRRVSRDDVLVDKGGYRHFMLKEIMEQPQAMSAALRDRVDFANGRVELPGFPLTHSEISQLDRILLIGCGTSLHAAQVGRHYIERLGRYSRRS